MEKTINIETNYQFKGTLAKRKVLEYLPAMIITNLSTLLLVSVDGLVVGNLLGEGALASVNIFYPVTLCIGVLSTLVASGAATCLSEAIGQIDLKGLLQIRGSLKVLIVAAAIFVALIQIPVVAVLIGAYNVSPDMKALVWQYATGIMISLPFGLVSTVGALQLQIVGKMKVLMGLACIEGVTNLLLDLLFVGGLKIGVAGAGYGTAGANILRCVLTVLYLAKKTDMYYSGGEKAQPAVIRKILLRGLPETTQQLMLGLQNYMLMTIILSVFGEAGGAIKGVVSFAFSVSMVVIGGIQSAMRPMTGLLCGAQALKALHTLMRHGILFVLGLCGALLAFIELFPELFYVIHGVKDIPEGGIESLQFAALSIIFIGFNTLFMLYFTNRKILVFPTVLAVVGNATLPGFAFLFSRSFPFTRLWLAYLATETVILIANLIRYYKLRYEDRELIRKDETVLYLTVVPDDAIEASRALRKYAAENGINRRNAFRVALCLEEMTAYAEKSHGTGDVSLEIIIRFYEDSAMLMILDDGKCIFLDREEEKKKLITTNYGLLKKVSKSVEYQYILNMNYTICRY